MDAHEYGLFMVRDGDAEEFVVALDFADAVVSWQNAHEIADQPDSVEKLCGEGEVILSAELLARLEGEETP